MDKENEPFDLNDDVKQAGDTRWLMRKEWMKSVCANRTTNQSIPSGVATVIDFENEEHDTDSMWAVGNPGRFYAPYDGVYHAFCQVRWEAAGGGTQRTLYMYTASLGLRAAHALPVAVFTGIPAHIAISKTVRMAVGDYVYFAALQDSGGPLVIQAGSLDHIYGGIYRVA